MERIKLTRNEKKVLRLIADGQMSCPAYIPADEYTAAVWTLEQYGLVRAAREEGGGIVVVRLTEKGRSRIAADPTRASVLQRIGSGLSLLPLRL